MNGVDSAIQPIRRRKVYQEVAGALEKLIREGTFPEGGALPSERALMDRFKVGRPAIREALLALERNGLVALSSGERARVTRPNTAHILGEFSSAARAMLAAPEGMRHFQSARTLFESALARHAARHASAGDIATLLAALDRNIAARGDPGLFQRTDVAFHYEIARIAANPLFLGLHEALTTWLLEQRTVSLARRGAERHAVEFHGRIFAAIAAHDADAAEAAMQTHLNTVADLYWRVANARAPKP